jgi:hypothetical protein
MSSNGPASGRRPSGSQELLRRPQPHACRLAFPRGSDDRLPVEGLRIEQNRQREQGRQPAFAEGDLAHSLPWEDDSRTESTGFSLSAGPFGSQHRSTFQNGGGDVRVPCRTGCVTTSASREIPNVMSRATVAASPRLLTTIVCVLAATGCAGRRAPGDDHDQGDGAVMRPAFEVTLCATAPGSIPGSIAGRRRRPARRMDIALMVWLISAPNSTRGRTVLMDAGFYRKSSSPDGNRSITSARVRLLGAWASARTRSPTSSSRVHWDHLDGADLFPMRGSGSSARNTSTTLTALAVRRAR